MALFESLVRGMRHVVSLQPLVAWSTSRHIPLLVCQRFRRLTGTCKSGFPQGCCGSSLSICLQADGHCSSAQRHLFFMGGVSGEGMVWVEGDGQRRRVGWWVGEGQRVCLVPFAALRCVFSPSRARFALYSRPSSDAPRSTSTAHCARLTPLLLLLLVLMSCLGRCWSCLMNATHATEDVCGNTFLIGKVVWSVPV